MIVDSDVTPCACRRLRSACVGRYVPLMFTSCATSDLDQRMPVRPSTHPGTPPPTLASGSGACHIRFRRITYSAGSDSWIFRTRSRYPALFTSTSGRTRSVSSIAKRPSTDSIDVTSVTCVRTLGAGDRCASLRMSSRAASSSCWERAVITIFVAPASANARAVAWNECLRRARLWRAQWTRAYLANPAPATGNKNALALKRAFERTARVDLGESVSGFRERKAEAAAYGRVDVVVILLGDLDVAHVGESEERQAGMEVKRGRPDKELSAMWTAGHRAGRGGIISRQAPGMTS
jgi:hypothetical protein